MPISGGPEAGLDGAGGSRGWDRGQDFAAGELSARDFGKSGLRRAQLHVPWVCSSQAVSIFAGGVVFGKLLCRLSLPEPNPEMVTVWDGWTSVCPAAGGG